LVRLNFSPFAPLIQSFFIVPTEQYVHEFWHPRLACTCITRLWRRKPYL
jgi:hypothetical protein